MRAALGVEAACLALGRGLDRGPADQVLLGDDDGKVLLFGSRPALEYFAQEHGLDLHDDLPDEVDLDLGGWLVAGSPQPSLPDVLQLWQLLVDAPYLLYRAFFALPDKITGAEGKPVNALLGSVNAILSAAQEEGARATICCMGPDAAPYRTDLYPAYHAHRPPMPRDLAWQWERAPALYEALGWAGAYDAELEADDLLGAYARAEEAAGGEAGQHVLR